MVRRRGRLARTMLRGLLLVGGAFGAWSAYGAVADEPAYAAGASGQCLLGELVDGVGRLLGAPLSCAPSAVPNGDEAADGTRHSGNGQPSAGVLLPAAPAPPGDQRAAGAPPAPARDVPPADEAAVPPRRDAGKPDERAPATAGPGSPASASRPPTRQPAAPPAPPPANPAPDAPTPAPGPAKPIPQSPAPALGPAKPILKGLGPALGPASPIGQVLDPVLDLAKPVVGALEPVLDLAAPVVDVLAPVLDVAQPAPGAPAGPRTPPGSGAGVRSPLTAPPPATSAPAGTTHATALVAPDTRWHASISRPSAGDQPADGDADPGRHRPEGDPGHAAPGTPGGCGSTAGSATAGGPSGAAEGALPWAWHPELWPLGGHPARSDELSHRASRPDTRPA